MWTTITTTQTASWGDITPGVTTTWTQVVTV